MSDEDPTRPSGVSRSDDAPLRPLPRARKEVLALLGFVVACLGVGALGGLVTGPAVRTWYQEIVKPPLNPPSWVFGPTWTLLYVCMAWAAFLAWRRCGLRSRPLALFGVQLLLNAAWSPVFFGLQALGAAVVVIVALWLAILLTLVAFWRVERLAGALLIPYLAWVSFATYLNIAIWLLNPAVG